MTRVERRCGVVGCDREYSCRGFCNLHYQRMIHHGSAEYTPPTMEDRFWSKVQITGFCWEWRGASDNNGYGVFNKGTKTDRAHRVAYELLVGAIPAGLVVDHLCRNRICCNPDHLEPVTARVNFQRAESPAMRTKRTNVCARGHSMSNAYVRREGWRMCRTCAHERSKRRTHASKSETP